MGYFGSVAQMIESLKYNNSLLKRPKAFSRLKKVIHQQQTSYHKTLNKKEVDAKELKIIKEGIRLKLREERRRNNIILAALAITISTLITYIVLTFVFKPRFEYTDNYLETIKEQAIEEKKAQEKFEFYLTDGYKWLKKDDYENALFQFELAVKKKPNNYEANLGLAFTLLKKCYITKKDCERADKQLSTLLTKFSDKTELKNSILDFLLTIGDTAKAEKQKNIKREKEINTTIIKFEDNNKLKKPH